MNQVLTDIDFDQVITDRFLAKRLKYIVKDPIVSQDKSERYK